MSSENTVRNDDIIPIDSFKNRIKKSDSQSYNNNILTNVTEGTSNMEELMKFYWSNIMSKSIVDKKYEYIAEGEIMNSDDILKSYMNKIDSDQRELKIEMREREERTQKSIESSESRMDARLEKIEKMMENQNKSFENKFNKMEDKFDVTVKEIKSNKISIWGICIATILAIGAIAVASMQVVQGMINLVK